MGKLALKQFVIILASIGVLAGSYVYSFGTPEAIASLLSDTSGGGEQAAGGPAQRGPGGPGGGGPRGGRNQASTVVMAPLETRPYDLVLSTIGSANSLRNADVFASESGKVVESNLTANAMVLEGDILLRLDDRTQRLSLEIANAELEQARSTVDRYTALNSAGTSTVSAVALTEAQVALRLAEANVGMAEVALENRLVRAPISGQLGLSDVKVGDVVNSSQVIVTIDDSSTLLAEFEVPERSIGLLSVGKTVLVGTPTYAGRVFEGTVTSFDNRLDPITRSATVKAEIDNSDGLLLSGMTFAVRMIEETEPLPTVPATAITWDRSGAGIWVSEDGRASRHPIAIRYRQGDQVWIQTDVPPGSSIVTEGAAKLREGATVTAAAGVSS